MLSFLHSGDLGDIIYGLPSIKAKGGGILYLCSRPFTKPMTQERFDLLRPLLLAQPYIQGVAWHQGEKIDFDLSSFRMQYGRGRNLSMSQAIHIGADPDCGNEKWLEVGPVEPNFRVVIHRSARYQNPLFPWRELIEFFGEHCLFVGPDYDYHPFVSRFGEIPRISPTDFLGLAKLIAGCWLFVGNQSSPYSVAEGLKVNSIQETSPRARDCLFPRDNGQFIGGDTFQAIHPVTKQKRSIIKSPRYFHSESATRPVALPEGRFVHFTLTHQFAGAWRGVCKTNDDYAIGALSRTPGIGEISEAQYETELRKK